MSNGIRNRSKVGSVKQLDNGRWAVRVSAGYKRDGKRKILSCTCDTEKEAEIMRMRLAIDAGKMPNLGDDMTLSEYYRTMFVPERKLRGLAEATMNRYESCWKRIIEPAFGDRGMNTIRHAEIQGIVYGLSHYEAKHFVSTLRAILRSAWDDELLDAEPMRHRMRYPRNERPQRGVWDAATVMRAMPVMEGTPIEALWLLMVGAGLRREEAYALFWRDIEFEEILCINGSREVFATITVDDAYTVEDGRKPVKTEFSRRVAIVSEPFASRLRELAGAAAEPVCGIKIERVGKAWRRLWEKRPLKKDGTPYARDNPNYYKGRMLDAGIPYIQMSRMRATHETIMQACGIEDTLNARLHGRSDSSQVGYTNYLNPGTSAFLGAARAVGEAMKEAANA